MSKNALFKPTIQVTVFSIFGIILGFINQVIIAYFFGTSSARDAYFAALVIPTYLTILFVGSIGMIFMSSYIEHLTHKSKIETYTFVSKVFNIVGLILLAVIILGSVFSKEIIMIFMPGFQLDQVIYTSELLTILLPTSLFLVFSNFLTTIFQAHHKFLLPAVVPVIGTLITILSVILLNSRIGIKSLAVGSLLTAAFNFVLLVPVILKKNRYYFQFSINKEVKKILKIAAPLFLAGIFYRSTTIIERMIASTLEKGSISYLGYANQLVNYLSIIAAGGIATTIFPLMSKGWELNDYPAVRTYFAKGIKIVFLTTIPIAVLFISIGKDIIKFLFERGAFNENATIAVSQSLSVLMVAFVCLSLGSIVAKGFYLTNKTKIFSLIVSSEIIIYLCLGYFLSKMFSFIGLAIALSVSSLYTITISLFVLRKIFNGLGIDKILSDLVKITVASILMGVLVIILRHLILVNLPLIFNVFLSGVSGVFFFILLITYVLQVEDIRDLKDKIIVYTNNKVKRKTLGQY